MIYVTLVFLILIVAGVTAFSSIYGIGLMLFVLICHGIFSYFLGSAAQHLPFFSGIFLVIILLLKYKIEIPSFLSLVLFFLFTVITLLSASFEDLGITSLLKYLMYFKAVILAFVVMCYIKTRKDLNLITKCIIVSALLGSIFNIYQQIFGIQLSQDVWDPSLNRAAGLRGDPNDTAMLLVMSLPFFYYRFLNAELLKQRLFLVIGALITTIGIIFTGSRAGFVSFFLIAVFILFHNYRGRRPTLLSWPKPRQLVLVLIICLTAAVFAPVYYWQRMDTLITGKEIGQSRSLYSRTLLLKEGLQIWMENPIIGVGMGNFGKAFEEKVSRRHMGTSSYSYYNMSRRGAVAHNMYLELLVETGLIGWMLFILISLTSLLGFFRLDFFQIDDSPYKFIGYGYALSLFSMLFFGLFLSQGYNSVLWFMLGLGVAAKRIGKSNASSMEMVSLFKAGTS